MKGLDDMLDKSRSGHFAYLTQKDILLTGAARTMKLDVQFGLVIKFADSVRAIAISAGADGGPRSRVCARLTLR